MAIASGLILYLLDPNIHSLFDGIWSAWVTMTLVAFSLVWIFPAISFEIGVLIGAVSLSTVIYFFISSMYALPRIYLPTVDDDYIVDKDYEEYDLDHSRSARPTRSNRTKRR